MAENVLLSSPRWPDKQMPDPGLALRQEAKIRPATAPGDLLRSRRISGAKKNSLKIFTRSLQTELLVIDGYLFRFPSLPISFCEKFTLAILRPKAFFPIKYQYDKATFSDVQY